MTIHYADLDKYAAGAGTSANPYNYSQIANWASSASEGDVLKLKGEFSTAAVFTTLSNWDFNISATSWEDNWPWYVSLSTYDMDIFADSSSPPTNKKITIINGIFNTAISFDLSVSPLMNNNSIEFRNCIFFEDPNSVIGSSAINVYFNGCTFADNLSIISYGGGPKSSQYNFNDCVFVNSYIDDDSISAGTFSATNCLFSLDQYSIETQVAASLAIFTNCTFDWDYGGTFPSYLETKYYFDNIIDHLTNHKLNYRDFNVPQTFDTRYNTWSANDYTDCFEKTPRTGPGAFIFYPYPVVTFSANPTVAFINQPITFTISADSFHPDVSALYYFNLGNGDLTASSSATYEKTYGASDRPYEDPNGSLLFYYDPIIVRQGTNSLPNSSATSVSIVINPYPNIIRSGSGLINENQTFTIGNWYEFDDSTISAVDWDFGNGSTSASLGIQDDAVASYSAAGSYTVSAVVYDISGNSATDTYTSEIMNAYISANTNIAFYDQTSIDFALIVDYGAGNTGIQTDFEFDHGDGSTSSVNTIIVGTSGTEYSLNKIYYESNPPDYAPRGKITPDVASGFVESPWLEWPITFNLVPEITATGTFIINNDITFSITNYETTSTNIDTVHWEFGDGNDDWLDLDTSAVHQYTSADTYIITATLYDISGNTVTATYNIGMFVGDVCKLKNEYIELTGPYEVNRYGSNKLINLTYFLPNNVKITDTSAFLYQFEDYLNNMFEGEDGFSLSSIDLTITRNYLTSGEYVSADNITSGDYINFREFTYDLESSDTNIASATSAIPTDTYDDTQKIVIGLPTNAYDDDRKISILEKTKRLTELQDPDLIPIKIEQDANYSNYDFITLLAKNFGYQVDVSREQLAYTGSITDLASTENLATSAADIVKYLRFLVASLPQWYKIKTTDNAIKVMLYSFGLIGGMLPYYTQDYIYKWKLADENGSVENIPDDYYASPHFAVGVDIIESTGSITFDDDRRQKILDAIESVRPINTVFERLVGLATFDLPVVNIFINTRMRIYYKIQ